MLKNYREFLGVLARGFGLFVFAFIISCGSSTDETVADVQNRGGNTEDAGGEPEERTCVMDSECYNGETCYGGICTPIPAADDDDANSGDDKDDGGEEEDASDVDIGGSDDDADAGEEDGGDGGEVEDNRCKRDPDCSMFPGTPICEITSGKCVECLLDGHCIYPQMCSEGECVSRSGSGEGDTGDECKDVSDCKYGYDCNIQTKKCVEAPYCAKSGDCENGLVCGFISEPKGANPPWVGCGSANASGAPFGSSCHTHMDCYEWNCMEGYCTKLCETDGDCGGGFTCEIVHLTFGDSETKWQYHFCSKKEGESGGGQVYDGVCDAGQSCCPIKGGSVCLLSDCASIPKTAEYCDAQNECERGVAVSASDGAGKEYCLCLEECGGGASDDDDDDTFDPDKICYSGEVCNTEELQGYGVCLYPDASIPDTATYCDNYTGEGCRIGQISVTALDELGRKQCMCLTNCGAGSGYLGDAHCKPYECKPVQQALAYACLDDGMVPAEASYCDDYTGEGCKAGEFPVTARDPNGKTRCMCLKGC